MTPDRLLDHFDRISDAPDAIPRLRRFILDLAVRGKLVEQKSNDEPASELLKRIQAEKARLVKEGKLRNQEPTLPVEIGDQPFELPTNWEWARFGGIADFSAGRTPSRHDFSYWNTGDYPWASIADMTDGGVVVTTKETVSEKAKEHLFRSEPAPVGTLIMSFKLTIGKISMLGVPAFHNEAIISIHPHLVAMDAYLFKVLPRFSQQGDTKDAIKGATLNRESITNIFLPLPPLAEQNRIVAEVDELMALCDQLEAAQAERESRRDKLAGASLHRVNNGANANEFREHARFHFRHLPRLTTRPEHIQQLRQTILNLAVSGKLVPRDPKDEPASELLKRIQAWRSAAIAEGKIRMPRKQILAVDDSEAPYELPKLWDWVRLGQIIYIHSGDGLTSEAMRRGSVPVFGGNGITGFHDTPNVLRPTVVIGRLGYYCGSIHVTPSQAWITDNAFITEFCTDAIFQNFLVLLLKATNLKENEKATAQPVISGAKIYPIIVGLPPLAEQHRIVAKVDEVMALCNRLEAQLNTTQKLQAGSVY